MMEHLGETSVGKFIRIKFDSSSVSAGFGLALRSDSVVYTADPSEFLVPETTVKKLEEQGIKFTRLS